MLSCRSFLASMMVLSSTMLAIGADRDAKPADKKAAPEPQPGWIIVEEDVWIRLNDEPSLHMHQAHESFLKKDYGATSRELRKAAGYLNIAARNASSDTTAALTASASELDSLAVDVQAGRVKSVKRLDSAFARAEHALGADDHAKAKTALDAKHHAIAGHYLSSAVNHVEDAAKWSGHKLESGTVATANGVRIVAGKLIDGSGFLVGEAEKGVTWVGNEVEKFGRSID
jgi:hypothetical protein